jgi:hypothetical protein
MRVVLRFAAAIVAIGGIPGAARADVVASVNVIDVDAGASVGVGSDACPPGMLVVSGGGEASNAGTDALVTTDPIGDLPVGSSSAPSRWVVTAENTGAAQHQLAVVGICMSGARTIELAILDAAAASGSGQRVVCPNGVSALGGGTGVSGNPGPVLSATGPLIDDGTADGARLLNQPDGQAARAIGWRGAIRNPGSERFGDVVAVCQGGVETKTYVASTTIAAGDTGNARSICPAGQVAFGGGVDDDDDFHMVVTSSSPLFDDGSPDGQRSINAPLGANPAPFGWFGSARNLDGSPHTLKVAAICPEPSRAEVADGTLLAVGAVGFVRRRRRPY